MISVLRAAIRLVALMAMLCSRRSGQAYFFLVLHAHLLLLHKKLVRTARTQAVQVCRHPGI